MPIIDNKIRCAKCSEWKGLENFQRKDQERGSGYCCPCKRDLKRRWYAANHARDSERRRELYAARKSPDALQELQRRRELRSDERRKGRKAAVVRHRLLRYGLSEAEYQRLVAEQGGRCAVCGTRENIDGRLWCVDHDHLTGNVRGLLCVRCNAGIGALGDTIDGVRRALAYLERAQQQSLICAAPTLRINLLARGN